MARRRRAKSEQEEVTLSLTPLIDVTFLLLIFFMCAMKFKTLERKVAAHLPTNRGIANTKIVIEEVLTIKVTLKRTPGETVTRVKFVDSMIGTGNTAFAELGRRIAWTHSQDPEMPGEIDAWAEVPHEDVVRCVDAFLAAGIDNVTFVGTKPKRAGN